MSSVRTRASQSGRSAPRRGAAWLLALIAVLPASFVAAQGNRNSRSDDGWPSVGRRTGGESDSGESSSSSARSGRRPRRTSADDEPGMQEPEPEVGINVRAGHLGMKTFGRNGSLTHAELFPYVTLDTHLVFGDVRFFTSNDLDLGGNAGLGYRWLHEGLDRVFGVNGYYDYDATTGEPFQQVGFGLETLGEHLDVRANAYFPIGETERIFSTALLNSRFVGNQILFDLYRKVGEAMPGVDIEAGALLPGDFARDHSIRLFGGWYRFIGDTADDISGYRVRVEGSFSPYFTARTEYTRDDTWGSNVMVGGELQFSGGTPRARTRSNRSTDKLRRWPQRNYNVIAPTDRQIESGLVAINPATGQPFQVVHVSSAGVGANLGTAADPFPTIAQAQGANADIIFVQGGSTFFTPILMNPNERILGAGATHFVAAAGYGALALPDGAGSGAVKPVLMNAGVTLASGVELAGFTIDSPAANGITGTGVSNVLLRDIDILDTGADGVRLTNAGGAIRFQNVTITDSVGAGLHVDGGNADITGGLIITNANIGRPVHIENTTGGTVDLRGSTIFGNGSDGLLVFNAAGDALFNGVTMQNTAGPGVDVQNTTGDVTFTGTTNISGATTAGIRVVGTAGQVQFANAQITGAAGQAGVVVDTSPGAVGFGRLDVTTDGGTALSVANSGLISIAAGSLRADNGIGVDIDTATMAVSLTSVSSNNAAVGIRLIDSPGQFVVLGANTLGSGGVIEDNVVGVQIFNSGSVGLRGVDFDDNGVGLTATTAQRVELSNARFTDSADQAIDALNVRELFVTNSLLSNNGAGGDDTIRVRADAAATYDTRLLSNTINAFNGSGVTVANSGAGLGSAMTLLMTANQINNTRANDAAVSVIWNGPLTGTFTGNLITGTGGTNRGFDISATSPTHLAQLDFTDTLMNFTGGNDTGLRLVTAAGSNITAVRTQIDFNAANGTGMDFSLARSATVGLTSNLIVDHVGGANGIVFTSLAGASSIALNDNRIGPSAVGIVLNRGIFFNAIDTTNGLVQLSGTQALTNIVQSAFQPFAVPFGTTTGTFFINGVAAP